jgi:phage N-6-adenine-methyltransferase
VAGYHPPSKTVEWATPADVFARISDEFGPFDLDAAASPENAKCARYYTKADSGLDQPWTGRVWVNPPYGREISLWIEKARRASHQGATVVLLLPARTDTKWFHGDVLGCRRAEVRFLKGRIKFGGATAGAPFPTMLVVYRPGGAL